MTLTMNAVTLNAVGRQILPPTTLQVPDQHMVGLTAPSGAGKTSLLALAALIKRPDTGEISIDQVPIPWGKGAPKIPVSARQRIGVLPQDPRRFADPRLTLAQTVTAPLAFRDRRSRPAPKHYQDQLLALADQLRLPENVLDRHPSQVSDGQLQRALLARALSLNPTLILCDEPTSALDPATTTVIFEVLRSKADQGACVVVASHDRASLAEHCDEIVPLADLQKGQ